MLNGNKCSVCGGTGKLYPLNSDGSVNYNRVVTCNCVLNDIDAERTKNFLQSSGIGSLGKYTFEYLNEQDKGQNAVWSAALKKAQAFAAAPAGWFYISGSYGPAKSHLAAAIVMATLKNSGSAAYKTAVEVIQLLRSPLDEETSYSKSLEFLRSCDILIVDEISSRLSAWEQERLSELLMWRTRQDLPSVISAACTPAELNESWSSKINDRSLCQICDLGENVVKESDGGFDIRFNLQKKMTFASFDPLRKTLPQEQQYSLKAAYNAAKNFAEKPEGWLIITGSYGVGKTHLAAAIANTRYALGQKCLFTTVPELADSLRQAYANVDGNETYDELLNKVKNTSLLVLDDFGAEAPTAWSIEKLYQIVSYRYNAQLPMVVTTKNIEEVAKRDERVASRFCDYSLSTTIGINVPDYRRTGSAPTK